MSTLLTSLESSSNRSSSNLSAENSVELEPETIGKAIFTEILAETKGELGFINPENLQDSKSLGQGTSFHVTREVYSRPGTTDYYVAVKRVIVSTRTPAELEKRLSVIRRELRVLMHPHLRSHSCITAIQGHGYLRDISQNVIPYLVMEYSDHGTLTTYLRRCAVPLEERHELAVDVAVGLQSLHDCHIIHGDLKIENVLVFSAPDNQTGRPQMARVADFGSSIFEDDFRNRSYVQYLGTRKYNAPEIQAREGPGVKSIDASYHPYTRADIYSFGLLLLEVTLNGESFVDSVWLQAEEDAPLVESEVSIRELEFLDTVTLVKEDYLLELAADFSKRLTGDQNFTTIRAIEQTLRLCLRDDFSKRQSMQTVVEVLARNIDRQRPRRHRTMQYTHPPTSIPTEEDNAPPRRPGAYYRMMTPTSDNLIVRMLDPEKQHADCASGLVQRSTHTEYKEVEAATTCMNTYIDPFRISVTVSPPWHVQTEIANHTKHALKAERQSVEQANLHLQLSVFFYLGYGLAPDIVESLKHMKAAVSSNSTARCIYPSILAALREPEVALEHINTDDLNVKPEYSNYVAHPSQNILQILQTLRQSHPAQKSTEDSVHERLTAACRQGDFGLAERLITHCREFPEDYAPNPLHWIIMFPFHKAKILMELLLTDSSIPVGACRRVLNASCKDRINISECCMDLFGTPLQWATRCGYHDVVSELIRHGADINIRWEGNMTLHNDTHNVRYPSFSALDIAVTYHFAEIVQTLLREGAKTHGGDLQWEYSAFHMIGQKTKSFARYVAHGSKSRKAVVRTIHVLRETGGLDINDVDSVGQTPLICAASNLDLELYILVALLNAGALASGNFRPEDGNIATLVARTCMDRRYTSKKLTLLLDQVEDINELDIFGFNALHYCAVADGVNMARILLTQPTIDVDCKALNKMRSTALLLAAMLSSVEFAKLLIDHKADIELEDSKGSSPLDAAVGSRHIEIARLFIESGANCTFGTKDGAARENVLHVAVVNASGRPSVAKRVLDILPSKKTAALINVFNRGGWTPLHVAAYFGDNEGTRALLQAGADRTLYKHAQTPLSSSLGGTPHQLVTRLLEYIEKKGRLHPDHKAIQDQGRAAEIQFKDRLRDIARILEY